MTFELHPKLQAESFWIGDLSLSQLRLMNDTRFLWFLLIPQKPGVIECFDLCVSDQNTLLSELRTVAQAIRPYYVIDKLNIAMIGNIVPQLHAHLVIRTHNDIAWPMPVWGFGQPTPYTAHEVSIKIQTLQAQLQSIIHNSVGNHV